MPVYELDCADCGAPCEVYRRNGKYCRSCALLRKLTAAANATPRHRVCRVCHTKFAPLHVKDHLCAGCAPLPGEPGHCTLCRQDAVLPYRGVTVCLRCIKGAPAEVKRRPDESAEAYAERAAARAMSTGRPAVIKALRAGQARRKETYAGRERRALTLISNDDTAILSP